MISLDEIDEFDEFDDIDLDEIEDFDGEWDEMDNETPISQEAAAQRKKKKSSFSKIFTFVIVFGGLAIGSYILYTTFKPYLQRTESANSATANNSQTVVQDNSQENTAQNNIEETIEPLFMQDDGLPPMPTPLSGDQLSNADTVTNNPELTPLPELEDIELEPLPSLEDIQTPASSMDNVNSNERAEMQVQQLSSTKSSNTIETSDSNSLLAGKLEALENDMDSQFNDSDARFKALDEKTANIEKMLVRIERRLSQVQTAPKTASKQIKVPTAVAQKPILKPVFTPSAPAASSKPTVRAVPKIVEKTEWKLRSAQRGKATVSRKGSNDIRSIQVGDTLSGIGRVQSISNASGKWVVSGTTGKVSQ